MRLASLLPRPLDTRSGTECATILGSLLTAAHLDRHRARALGWRGVRPSGTGQPAWTCRVAASPHVFGLFFLGEQARAGLLHGEFAAFVFPGAEDPILDAYPLAALRLALDPGYPERIRDIAAHSRELAPFQLGTLHLSVRTDGTGLSLALVALARHRVVALNGVAVPGRQADVAAPGDQAGGLPGPDAEDWLILPGGLECDLPAFRMLLRLFGSLTATLEEQFGEKARLLARVRPCPLPGFDASGAIRPLPGNAGRQVRLIARLGEEDGQGMAAARGARSGRVLPHLPVRRLSASGTDDERPVLHVLTGFLGAGKTTVLKRWLDFLHGRERYTGVIQNEFGQIGLDAVLLRDDTRVEALDDGCVCCSLADSLRPGLLRLMADMPARQFILETTGLAHPTNVLAALAELQDLVRPGLMVTVVDALDVCRADQADPETDNIRRAQLERADVVIANKADAVTGEALDTLLARLRRCNSQALLLPARHGNAAFAELDAWYAARLDQGERTPSRRPFLDRRRTHRHDGYASLTLRLDAPVTPEELQRLLRQAGPGLYRAKGLIRLQGRGPVVAQYATGRLDFEPAPRPSGTDEPHDYLVLIGRDLRDPDSEDRFPGPCPEPHRGE